jgi:outer membrane protein W
MARTTITLIVTILFVTKLWGQTDQVKVNLNDSTELTLERVHFDKSGKKFEFFDKYPIAINGRPIFGTDGDFPKYTLIKATLTIGKNKYDLQVEDMYNPWFGDGVNEKLFKIQKEGTELKLTGLFSDGAGTYGAEWLIVGKSSIRTSLTKDEWRLFEYIEGE